jgi:hypothetical protein
VELEQGSLLGFGEKYRAAVHVFYPRKLVAAATIIATATKVRLVKAMRTRKHE